MIVSGVVQSRYYSLVPLILAVRLKMECICRRLFQSEKAAHVFGGFTYQLLPIVGKRVGWHPDIRTLWSARIGKTLAAVNFIVRIATASVK